MTLNNSANLALRPKNLRALREIEVLRVAGMLGGSTEHASAVACRETLSWAQNRLGTPLPDAAWDFSSFEALTGGRTTMAVRLQRSGADIWSLRIDDPDKEVAGRIWTTEVVVGQILGERPRFSLRLLSATNETSLEISPHVPGIVQQISSCCGLYVGSALTIAESSQLHSDEDARHLINEILSPKRKIPILSSHPLKIQKMEFLLR